MASFQAIAKSTTPPCAFDVTVDMPDQAFGEMLASVRLRAGQVPSTDAAGAPVLDANHQPVMRDMTNEECCRWATANFLRGWDKNAALDAAQQKREAIVPRADTTWSVVA